MGVKFYASMPLKKNVSKRENWKEAKCPQCGQDAWYMPQMNLVKEKYLDQIEIVCTECALSNNSERRKNE